MINFSRRLWSVLLLVLSILLSGLSPALADWTAPVDLNSPYSLSLFHAGNFPTVSSLTVQENGVAHIVSLEKKGKRFSIVHLTNKTGDWQKETIQSSVKRLSSPAAAIVEGRLYLAWVKGSGLRSEIAYATNAAGAWSTAMMTDNSVGDLYPAVDVRRGKVYVSWIHVRELSGGYARKGAVKVRTNATGRWRTTQLGRAYIWPGAPVVKVDDRGAAHIVYTGKYKFGGLVHLLHADNTAGKWRRERLPVNTDKSGRMVSALMPSLALNGSSVFIAFTRVPNAFEVPDVAMVAKRKGAWKVRVLTKSVAFGPRISADKGRVKIVYSKMLYGADYALRSQARYLELVDGRVRGRVIDEVRVEEPFGMTETSIPIFFFTGFEDKQGLLQATYLKAEVGGLSRKVKTKLFYVRQ